MKPMLVRLETTRWLERTGGMLSTLKAWPVHASLPLTYHPVSDIA